MKNSNLFRGVHLNNLRVNLFATMFAWLLVVTAIAGGTGNLDLFSGVKSNSSTDTLKLYSKDAASSPVNPISEIPDHFKLYDLDLDGRISEWEMKDAVKDFKEKDTPYSRQEMTAFLDYFFKDR